MANLFSQGTNNKYSDAVGHLVSIPVTPLLVAHENSHEQCDNIPIKLYLR